MIELHNITHAFGERTIFSGVNLQVMPGQLCCVTGASGSGKTTLLHIIAGLQVATAGTALVDDVSIISLAEDSHAEFLRSRLGLVFQDAFLLPEFLVWENIGLKGFAAGWYQEKIYLRAKELAEYLGIAHLLNRSIYGLSGGEQQRVALARALFLQPRYLLADEPTSALDDGATEQFLELLQKTITDYNLGVILVSHDQRVFRYADVMYRLQECRVTKI